ncbi:MAG: DUF2721 domain-containing protein [Cytophagia bacterium]|jgi:hypothetical protein|nr:DUF2721 domain-containing protein [Cytophagia bacterium]
MEISLNTPALLFPAITLMMLAYTNRFLALATLIRNLHTKYKQIQEERDVIREQIRNLKERLILIRYMQSTSIFSFFLCVLSMLFIYFQHSNWAVFTFGGSLFSLLLSLALSLREISISTRALEIELKNMEEEKS